jgi:hypothetical protein
MTVEIADTRYGLEEMLADTERLRGELDAREAVLSFLHPLIARERATKVERALVSSDVRGEHASVGPWRRAIDALMVDATAALPR